MTQEEFVALLNKKTELLTEEEKEKIKKFLEEMRKCSEKG